MKLFLILFIVSLLLTPMWGEETKPCSIANFEDSGVFKLYKNDSQIGTIEYTLDKQGNYDRKFTISLAGQKIETRLMIKSDKDGLWTNMVLIGPGGAGLVRRKGEKAEFTHINQEKISTVKLAPNHLLNDSYGPVFESILLKQYDMEKKGKQKFSRYLIPARIEDFEVEYKGREIRKIKEKEITFSRYDLDILGILVQVWAGKDFKIAMMNVPVQYAVFVREGFEDLLKVRIEDPSISKPQFETIKKTVMIPMRDGVKLATDLYFPGTSQGKFPVIFIRTPYKKEMVVLKGEYYSKRGYVVAIQDCRGRFASEGQWEPFVNEGDDGYDGIEWLGTRDWSNGKVGMIGGSYGGWVQLWAAVKKPPHLATIIPNVAPPDPFFNVPYEYGTFYLFAAIWWAEVVETEATGELAGTALGKIFNRKYEKILKKLPVIELDKDIFEKVNPYWRKWIKNNVNKGYWEKCNFMSQLKDLDIPVFLQSGWFDGDGIGTKLNYMELKKSKNKHIKMIVGPWGHTDESSSRLGDHDFGKEAALDLQSLYLRWFDFWLKGIDNKITREPLVQLFTMFSNQWLKADTYPLPQTQFTKFYISSQSGANSSKGDGKLVSSLPTGGKEYDKYLYDPGDPTPCPFYYFKSEEEEKKEGETIIDVEEAKARREAFHNLTTDARKDILVYRTEPLAEPLTVAGPLSAVLYASTSAKDTDWFVSLMDVDEEGKILVLARGTIRARFRNSFTDPQLLEGNKVYRYNIDLWHTGITFQKGHRIRVEVSSALFPLFSRNLNTGGHNEMETEYVKATQKVYHSPEYPSHILLPVIKK
jgi:putative CocE/NonD family hydrolase